MGYIDEKGLKTALEGVKQYVDSSNRTVDWDDIRNKPFGDCSYINTWLKAYDFHYDDVLSVYYEGVPLYIWNENTGEVTCIGSDEIVEFTCSNGEKLILQGKHERDSDGYIVWTITTIQPVYESTDNIFFCERYDIKTIDEKYIPNTIARQEDLTDFLPREEFEERIEGYATHDSVQELSENVAELRHDLGECDSRVGSALDMAEKHEEQFTELSAEVSGLSEGIALRNVGAEDTDESVEEPEIGGGGGGMSTPSGDPMHYMYEAVGAEWNGTGADIEKQGVYGDTITHKAGYWYLNELGDITNEEMRAIYVESNPMVRRLNLEDAFSGGTIRTNIAIWDANRSTSYGSIAHTYVELRCACGWSQIEVFSFITGPLNRNIQKHLPVSTNALSLSFKNASKLSKIIGCLNCSNSADYKTFEGAILLKEVRLIRLKNSFSFADSPLLSKSSVLFAIQNAEATTAITITLHADAYARLAEDADIVAALAEKEFVSLASA